MKLNLSFQFFDTCKDKWYPLPPLWITAGVAVFSVEEGVGICMSNNFCHDLSGSVVHFPDFEHIGEVDRNLLVSGVFEVLMDLLKNACCFPFFCERWLLLRSQTNGVWIVRPLGDNDAKVVPEIWPKTVSELEHGLSRRLVVSGFGSV